MWVEKILDWLSPEPCPIPAVKRAASTCSWIFDSQQYQVWTANHFSQLLWIYGIPGNAQMLPLSLRLSHADIYRVWKDDACSISGRTIAHAHHDHTLFPQFAFHEFSLCNPTRVLTSFTALETTEYHQQFRLPETCSRDHPNV